MVDTYIGIDPGEHNGVAAWDKQNGLRLYTLNFWELIEFIDTMSIKQRTLMDIVPHFYVENPGLNSFMYHQKIDNKNAAMALKIAQNVGQNKGDAKRIIERIRLKEMIIQEIRPNSKSQKWSSEFFNQLMRGRYQITTSNQHVRDAAKLIVQYWSK